MMRGYILKRILATIPVMTVVAIFVFSLLRLRPGILRPSSLGTTPTPRALNVSAKGWA
jgi:peptide/nickel transport system permease protein